MLLVHENKIRQILSEVVSLTESMGNITVDTFLQSVGFDSISFVRLVVEIEDKFEIEFPDDKLVITQAGTIRQLNDIIISCK
ncbi:MAG TPA: phosphopantetheine-binding protein [Candidatus Paceibacterota bacterium]